MLLLGNVITLTLLVGLHHVRKSHSFGLIRGYLVVALFQLSRGLWNGTTLFQQPVCVHLQSGSSILFGSFEILSHVALDFPEAVLPDIRPLYILHGIVVELHLQKIEGVRRRHRILKRLS